MEKVPADLRKILAANAAAKAKWDDLTPIGRRDFVSWIESAKQDATRKRRVDSVPSRLASGKRRPCCYAVVPMDLYKSLDADVKAKAMWKDLTPDEKRTFSDWVNAAKDAAVRAQRTNKACALLGSGKRHP